MINTVLVRRLLLVMALPLVAMLLLWVIAPAYADDEPIKITYSNVTSEFPDGFRFELKASGQNDIVSAVVRLKIGEATRTAFNNFRITQGQDIDAELFWRTNNLARYIPPGTPISYHFELEDSAGNRIETKAQRFTYHDPRFEWSQISEGPITLSYHGPVNRRAGTILDAILETMGRMAPVLGSELDSPINVTTYNNVREMTDALPPRSEVMSRGLVTEGQAFSEFGTLLILGGGSSATGTASHEVTHILVHRAGDGTFRSVPSWLHEGLAEFGNIESGDSYDNALEFAIGNDRLLDVMFMSSLPGSPEDVMIFYGQSKSIVEMMIGRFGADKMKDLMAAFKNNSVDNALEKVYGLDREQLDAMWRESVGAPQRDYPRRVRPTPLPMREILPYSLIPQEGAELVDDKSDAPTEGAPTPLVATSAIAVEMVATPAPVTAPSLSDVTAEPDIATEVDNGPQSAQEKLPAPSSGGCAAPIRGANVLDLTSVVLLVGLVGLGSRRRISVLSGRKGLLGCSIDST